MNLNELIRNSKIKDLVHTKDFKRLEFTIELISYINSELKEETLECEMRVDYDCQLMVIVFDYQYEIYLKYDADFVNNILELEQQGKIPFEKISK